MRDRLACKRLQPPRYRRIFLLSSGRGIPSIGLDFPLKAGNLSQFQSPPTTRQAARRRPSSLGVNPAFEARPPVFCATPTSHLHRSRGVCGWSFRLGYPCPGQSPTWHAEAARGVCPRTAVAPPAKLAHRRLKAGRSALQADGGGRATTQPPRRRGHRRRKRWKKLKPRAVPTAAALPASSEGKAHDPQWQRPRPPGRWGRQRRGVGGRSARSGHRRELLTGAIHGILAAGVFRPVKPGYAWP